MKGQRDGQYVFCTFNTPKTSNRNVIISASMETNKKKPLFPLPPASVDPVAHKITPRKLQS